MSDKCEKRVLIHSGTDLSIAIAAASSFNKDHILGNNIPTGVYHSRKYVSGDNTVEVYHSSTSIIVRNAAPEEEPPSKDELAEMTPEEEVTK